MFPVMALTLRTETGLQYIYLIIVLFVAPIAWPILFRGFLHWSPVRKRVIHPTPKAWDDFFGRREICFVLVHLRNGNIVGGLYAGNSFTSSFPHEEDIYLEEVWYVDENGQFQGAMPNTKGMLITRDAFDYLELFEVPSD